MCKYYEIMSYGEAFRVTPIRSNYADGNLAVMLVCDTGEPFATVTKSLSSPGFLAGDEAFVDANNCPWAHDFLVDNGLAEPAGKSARSGYCAYDAYRFDLEKIPVVA